MENLETLSDLNDSTEVVIILPSGQLKKGGIGILADMIYELATCSNSGADIASPMWGNGLNKLYSCMPVKVGIGNDDPQHRLHVSGVSYAPNFLAGHVSGNTNAMINGYSSVNEELVNLGTYNSTTNTSTARFKIMNDGTVYAKEVWVRPITQFPDYVFEDDYHLLNLMDLKVFIESNNRLPKMPSAKEVNSFGMSLSAVQILLVEKIEELTLYTIGHHEEIEKLKIENQNLKSELDLLKKEVNELKGLIKHN